MSGMAGNVSAFSTVWTYDIYKPLINKKGSDSHYVLVGRIVDRHRRRGLHRRRATWCMHAHGIMDYVQALFSIFIAPLLAAILLGMFWKRATAPGRLPGPAARHRLFGRPVHVGQAQSRGAGHVALSPDAKPMAENVFRALWAFLFAAIVIFVVSMFTKPRPVAELEGLVYGATSSAQGRAGSVLQE